MNGSLEQLRRLRRMVRRDTRVAAMETRIQRLQARVAELEADVEESRRLDQRVTELTDIVQELLLPVAQRDSRRLAELLERHRDRL